jgi:hypothetical protein
LHPLDDSRQCHAARIPISFAEQDTFYSPIRIETRLWRLTLQMTRTKPAPFRSARSAFLTALVIADCKRSREIELRFSERFFRYQAKTAPPGKNVIISVL